MGGLVSSQNMMPLILGLGLVVRLFVLVWGEWQDATMAVKYTDVDYVVFSDAAKLVHQGVSPFERTTYRYTPLLAWMLLPNIWIHKSFGKFLFVLADMVIAVMLVSMLQLRGIKPRTAALYACAWLFHPLSINVSTRGNADSLVCFLVLATLYLLVVKRSIVAGGMMFGLAVHFKVFPIIYAVPLYFFIDAHFHTGHKAVGSERSWSPLFTKPRLQFTAISAGTFLALGAVCYYAYGFQFAYETYLYHFVRTDNRHNFSVYFYDLYLRYNQASSRLGVGLIAFLPQFSCLLVTGLMLYSDLPLAMFVQTVIFVAFNKVCTAQYFLWYLSLIPLILPMSRLGFWKGWLPLIVGWFASEGLWLSQGFRLEFLGLPVFLEVWGASVVFFLVNIVALIVIIRHHEFVPTLANGAMTRLA